MSDSVLIIGGSVAGVGAANELRRRGYAGRITLVDAQPHLPYDRPPLSKVALGSDVADDAFLFHSSEHYVEKNIDLKLGSKVEAFDGRSRTVGLADGTVLSASAVLIASGARARLFPPERMTGAVHTIRDLDDAVRLRRELRPGRRLAVIGGGFIGAEVASSAALLGLHVVLVEAAGIPLQRVLGAEIARRLATLHQNAGIELICDVMVERIEKIAPDVQLLHLDNGRVIEADVVVAGLGSQPNIDWLSGSGVELGNGVICDAHGRTNMPDVFAAGDVASWWNPLTKEHERHEHWTAAREQARIVAHLLTGEPESRWEDFIAYFWSDMHGRRVQLLGSTRGAETIDVVFEDTVKGSLVAEFHKAGVLIGVVGINAGARTMRYAMRLSAAAADQRNALVS